MTDPRPSPHRSGVSSNLVLAGSTLLAAIFVAVQAWYARTSFVEASETRFLEKKLDICFQNFEAAAALDSALRFVAPGDGMDEEWPPRIVVRDAARMERLQRDVVPRLDMLEAGLSKASILGEPDKYRAYLAQQIRGLSKRLLDISPYRIGQAEMDKEVDAVLTALSEFLGAQYTVFAGCRLVAEGKA